MMLKLVFFSTFLCLITTYVSGQDNQAAIKVWQQQNPNVLFVSYERFELMSPEERVRLKSLKVIFYHQNINMDDIYAFDHSTKTYEDANSPHADEIKRWLGVNQDLKLIKQSTFINAPASSQNEYMTCLKCLVLIGEFITMEDILNFESENN